MTAQDTPIWLPAVRPPLGRTGWEGDAPVTDAFQGEEGDSGRARRRHLRAGRHTLPSALVLGPAPPLTRPRGTPRGPTREALDRALGCPTLGLPRAPQPGFEEPRLQPP